MYGGHCCWCVSQRNVVSCTLPMVTTSAVYSNKWKYHRSVWYQIMWYKAIPIYDIFCETDFVDFSHYRYDIFQMWYHILEYETCIRNGTLAETQAKLEEMKREQMQSFAERRHRSLENAEQLYYQNMHLGSRNIGSPQASTTTTTGVFVPRNMPRYECDYDKDPLNRSGEQRSEDLVDTPSDDVLNCPKCEKSFPIELHEELLEHLDKCG